MYETVDQESAGEVGEGGMSVLIVRFFGVNKFRKEGGETERRKEVGRGLGTWTRSIFTLWTSWMTLDSANECIDSLQRQCGPNIGGKNYIDHWQKRVDDLVKLTKFVFDETTDSLSRRTGNIDWI